MPFQPQTRQVRFGGLDRTPPRDVVLMVAAVFITYSLQFFTSALQTLRLSELAWQRGYLWQLLTYPWIGVSGSVTGPPRASLWILLELFILYMFAVDVFGVLGRRRFWRILVQGTLGAAVAALVIDAVSQLVFGGEILSAFSLMQGQRLLIVVIIAAFATLRSEATILLFFVLPVKARWFVWLEIAFAFIGFLGSKDLPGFVGLCTAVGLTVWLVRHPTLRGGLRDLHKRTEQRVLQRKLRRTREKSRLKVVRGEGSSQRGPGDGPPWVH